MQMMMSTSLKMVMALLVVVLIGSGVWWVVSLQSTDTVANNVPAESSEQTETQNNQPATTEQNSETITFDTSDAAIDSSFNEIDVELSGMASDEEQVNESLIQ